MKLDPSKRKLLIRHWKPLPSFEPQELIRLNDEIHRLCQFLSMIGKHYGVAQEDDSHTNLAWSEEEGFVGKNIQAEQPFYPAFKPTSGTLSLNRVDGGKIWQLDVRGRKKGEIEELLRKELEKIPAIDASSFDMNLHYEILQHPTDEGKAFALDNPSMLKTFEQVRANGHLLTEIIASHFPDHTEVATWPHHFDVGTYLVLERDPQQQMAKTISLGMAIHDSLVEGPYLYLNLWRKEGALRKEYLGQLSVGAWRLEGEFAGAVMPMVELKGKPGEQVDQATSFMEDALNMSFLALECHPNQP